MITNPLTPIQVEAAAMQRLNQLVSVHGILSHQVMECLERWGKILDDVRGQA